METVQEATETFSLGFRRNPSGRLVAFSEPDVWPEAMASLRAAIPLVRLVDCDEFRIVCAVDGDPVLRGRITMADMDRKAWTAWLGKLLELAEGGYEALVKSLAIQAHIPVEQIVEEWVLSLPDEAYPMCNQVVMIPVPVKAHDAFNRRRVRPRTVLGSRGPMLGLQALPRRVVPFARTANRLLLKRAQAHLEAYFESLCERDGDIDTKIFARR